MGMFQDLTFAGSRFTVGESYDENIDKSTKHSYVSDVGSEIMGPPKRTREEGVSQTADAFTNAQKLEEISRQVDSAQPIEVLLDVSAFDGVSLTGKPLVATTRKDPLFR